MLTDVLRKYQHYDPASGRFDARRGLREYGRLIGIDHSTLSLLFSTPDREPSTMVLQALTRTFPAAADDIATALKAQSQEVPA